MTTNNLLIETKDRMLKHYERWVNTVEENQELFSTLEKLKVEPRFNASDGCIDICFAGDKEMFTAVWAAIRNAGFQPDLRPTGEPKDNARFSTFFRSEGQAQLWFSFSSTTCKLIQKGTRMVEQPVYEVQCEDGAQTELGELLSSENDNAQARE